MSLKIFSLALTIGILLVSIAPAAVKAHSRFGCPPPRSNDFGEKSGPCGGFGRAGHPYTTFSPGLNTLVLAEVIYHPGSPWSIQLALGSDSDVYYLLDHIPQNSAIQSPSSSNPHVFSVNVEIPNINCTDCALIMFNPMVGGGSTCTRTNGACSAYHSCANIQIAGTQNPTTWASSYTYAPSGWSYTTKPLGSYTSESDSYSNGFAAGQSNKTTVGACSNFDSGTIPSYNGDVPIPQGPAEPTTPSDSTGPTDDASKVSYGVISYVVLLFTTLLAVI